MTRCVNDNILFVVIYCSFTNPIAGENIWSITWDFFPLQIHAKLEVLIFRNSSKNPLNMKYSELNFFFKLKEWKDWSHLNSKQMPEVEVSYLESCSNWAQKRESRFIFEEFVCNKLCWEYYFNLCWGGVYFFSLFMVTASWW